MESPLTADQLRDLSVRHAQSKDKEAWLGLFAEDAVVEDPVGVSPLDPTGEGHKGKAAISAHWDNVIGPATPIQYELISSCTRGNECACVIKFNGHTQSIGFYKATADGKLASLRSFWDFEAAVAATKQVSYISCISNRKGICRVHGRSLDKKATDPLPS